MSLYSNASEYAKDTWLPTYAYQLSNAEGSLLQMLGLNTDDRVKIEGRNAYMKVQIGDDLGFGMLTQGGDFPTPGDIASDEATLELHRFANTISFDSHEMALLDSLDAASAPIMRKKMAESRRRVLREMERQAIMDGTGRLAKVASVSGTTLTFDVAGSEYPERNPYTWIDDANRGRYRIVDPTDGTDQLATPSSFTLSAINESANTATASATLTGAAAGDYVVLDYPDGWTSGGAYRSLEMDGLLAMINDDNTYMGINRATAANAFWRSLVADNSGTSRALTESIIRSFLAKHRRRSERGVLVPSEYFAITSPGVWNSYESLMTPGLRYTVGETPDIGWGGREFLPMQGVKLYNHIAAPRNQILMVHKDSVRFVGPKHDHSSIVKFYEQGGTIFFQANATTGQGHADKVFAYILGWIGMYTERPRNHARLDDITETDGAY